MQAIPEEKVRVDPVSTVDVPTSFFMEEALSESVRRTAWDNVWTSMGLISSTYLANSATVNAEQATIFERNLGTTLVSACDSRLRGGPPAL